MGIFHEFLTLFFHLHALSALTINNRSLLPPSQDGTKTFNVHLPKNVDLTHFLTERWDAECHRFGELSMPGLSPLHCGIVAETTCVRISVVEPGKLRRETWVWTETPPVAYPLLQILKRAVYSMIARIMRNEGRH